MLGGRLLASVVAVLAQDAAPAVGAVPDGGSSKAASMRIAVEKKKVLAKKKKRYEKLMAKNPKLTESDLSAAEAAIETLARRSCPGDTGTAGPALDLMEFRFNTSFQIQSGIQSFLV